MTFQDKGEVNKFVFGYVEFGGMETPLLFSRELEINKQIKTKTNK
jgi:hypothetical protein